MPLTIDVSILDRGALGGVPGRGLDARLKVFIDGVHQAQRRAADTATRISRSQVTKVRPPAPARKGRYQGLRNAIQWRRTREGDGVGLALADLEAKFPVWEVQEIGTGQKAIRYVGGKPNPRGRPTAGARYVRSVRSQLGRGISNNFVFASGGRYSSPVSSRSNQQLFLRSEISDAPVRFDPRTGRSAPNIRIGREIPGMHFIKRGGEAGFREYETNVLAAARSQLRKRRT